MSTSPSLPLRRYPSRVGEAVSLLVFVLLALAAGGIGALLQGSALQDGGWYDRLDAPPFAPPDAVFAPVWTTLYVLIGISGWLLWRRRELPLGRQALGLWVVQLVLNASWTGAFFGLRSPALGLVVILVLLAAIGLLIVRAHAVDRRAAWLLVPYAAWVAFATALTTGFLYLN